MSFIMPRKSFLEKYGWKGNLSNLMNPNGLFDPVECREIRWIKAIKINAMGRRKCSVKKRFRVAFLIENPPHNHSTNIFPKYGIADTKFVITEAPQKDIWPHGSTYPRKAVAIIKNKIMIPEIHILLSLWEENKIPRPIWIKIIINIKDAPFRCMKRRIQPLLTSRMMWIIDEKAVSICGV